MKIASVYEAWTNFINDQKYEKFFRSKNDRWFLKRFQVESFMIEHGRRPAQSSKDKAEKELGIFISNQIMNYPESKEAMANEDVRNSWSDLVNDERFFIHFASNKEVWYIRCEQARKFLLEHGKRPSESSEIQEERQLCNWIVTQQSCFRSQKKIMAEEDVRESWIAFTSGFPKLFKVQK
jgi:hypothetical protein